jgi:hypothetical protein
MLLRPFPWRRSWALVGQGGLGAVEDQRRRRGNEELFPKDFIRKAFRVAESVCGMAAVRELRDSSFARGKSYFARGAPDFPFGD